MVHLEQLIAEAVAQGYGIKWRDLGKRRGEYRHHHRLIIINQRLTGIQARCTLAHELGHAAHGDTASTPIAEGRANRWAALKLITPEDYRAAEVIAGPTPTGLARELGVTREILLAWREVADSAGFSHVA